MATARDQQAAVEPGTAADAAAVERLSRASFDPRFREAWSAGQIARALADPGVFLLVVRGGPGELLGFALTRALAGEAELLLCAVLPAHRRSGLASALVAAAMAEARRMGARRMFLEVRESNGAARSLYRSLGFEPVGTRPFYYRSVAGEVANAITLSRSLA
ncbi:MAG: GNAT family N-acetyltransferase [Thermaurantiacus tibetensis]|uniref:GNAT family N-acetyltransferase n=1 Tax=Thermaurantiacus tibetensis TaxID=2759035 RepID=UPI0018900BE0|nr:GNAT family N-acetyltransferase [Thermaurantiacus tibetensis]